MSTIKDVAKMAGVSISTVSKYLNGGNVRQENLDPIRSAIAALDYHANPYARALKSQRSRSIGILLPSISAPFYGSIITTLDRMLRENNYHCLISCYGSDHGLERDYLNYLLNTGIDGLIYLPENLSADEFYELTSQRSIPVVQVDRIIQGIQADAILVDNTDAVYRSVCHLVRQGHKRIAIITGPKSVFTARERLVGYLRALSDCDIPYHDELVHSGELTFATGYQAFLNMMQIPNPPTAFLAANYDLAIGVLTAARERGIRIPEDIAFFGYDCVEVYQIMNPPLPVVHQPETEIGQKAATFLLERLNGYAGPPRQFRLKAQIIF